MTLLRKVALPSHFLEMRRVKTLLSALSVFLQGVRACIYTSHCLWSVAFYCDVTFPARPLSINACLQSDSSELYKFHPLNLPWPRVSRYGCTGCSLHNSAQHRATWERNATHSNLAKPCIPAGAVSFCLSGHEPGGTLFSHVLQDSIETTGLPGWPSRLFPV